MTFLLETNLWIRFWEKNLSMKKYAEPKLTNLNVGLPLFLTFAIWFIFWLEVKWDVSFNKFGVLPRSFKGLRGILFSPFIHSDASHLWHNTLPLLILSFSLFYFYSKQAVKVFFVGFFATGFFTWLLGRPSYHIGASGIVYLFFGFLLLKGLLTKHIPLLALSFFVVFVYGGMLWYVMPIDFKISWEGHLSGFLVGAFLAVFSKNKMYRDSFKYNWEKPNYNPNLDPFMQCFDENGKFVPTSARKIVKIKEELRQEVFSNIKVRRLTQKVSSKKINKVQSSLINMNYYVH